VSIALMAGVTIVVARSLGPVGNGRYALVAATFLFLLTLAKLGIELGAPWLVSSGHWPVGSAFVTTQAAALSIGAAVAGLGAAAFTLLPPELFGGVDLVDGLPVLAAVPFALAATYSAQIALATVEYSVSALILVVQALAWFVGVAVLTPAVGLEGAFIGLLVGQVAGFVVSLDWGRRLIRRRDNDVLATARVDIANLRRAMAFGLRAHGANVLALVTYRFDLFMVAAYASKADVGYYAVALAATNLVWLLPSALSAVLFPRISALAAAGEAQKAEDVKTRSLQHTTILLSVAVLAMAFALPLLLQAIFGARFGPAVHLALILLPGSAALGFASVFYAALSGRGHPGYAFRGALIVTPLAVVLYVLLIPPFHATGAAIASSIAYVAAAVVAGTFARHLTDLPVVSRLVPGRNQLMDYQELLRRFAPGRSGGSC